MVFLPFGLLYRFIFHPLIALTTQIDNIIKIDLRHPCHQRMFYYTPSASFHSVSFRSSPFQWDSLGLVTLPQTEKSFFVRMFSFYLFY